MGMIIAAMNRIRLSVIVQLIIEETQTLLLDGLMQKYFG